MGSPPSDLALEKAILQYLAEHPQAMDTAEGITRWWNAGHQTPRSTSAVGRALDRLVEKGHVEILGGGEQRRYGLKRRRTPR